MLQYFAKRLVSIILVLWVVASATFLLMHAIPGGPFTTEKVLPEAVLKNIEVRYKLNDPLWQQYVDYMGNLLRWDLGPSFKYEGETVNNIINRSFPISAQLGLYAILLALLVGIPAGIISALKQNEWPDNLAMFGATIGFSVPSFIMASLLMFVFALKLRWLPAAMWGTPQQAVLPTLALASLPMAFFARLVRSSMLEVMNQDYIRTAKAKGLSGNTVIWRHAVKNAIMPVVTYLGPLTASIMTGSFVVERIFAIPGLGQHFVTSIYNRDYTAILGITVFYSILLVLFNFIVDIAYAFIDPRIKYVEEKE
ncbi:MAG: ABC transporter permease [Firmicutes bacterium]|nr:ABC transporter permease [Bacillota bacterium]